MNKILLIFSMVFLLAGAAGAVDMSSAKAYPVPFNPKQDPALNILIPNSSLGLFAVSFTIYDINGDTVTSKSFAAVAYNGSTTVIWNGRNSRGRTVKAGLYIIKVVIENETTGGYGKKIIRILVKG